MAVALASAAGLSDTPNMTTTTIILAICCALMLAETAVFFRRIAALRSLSRMSAPEPAAWPRVSIVMAARNESHAVHEAVASRLADDYPDLEVIFVDDRSTDGTGEIAQAAAGADPQFTFVRVDELPDGWLGKVHALDIGARRATGEWLLFSDGDVSVRPGCLRRAIAHCVAEDLDMLALVPAFVTGSFWVDAVWTVFMRGLVILANPLAVRDPRSSVSMGSGAFNLVKRDALDRTPGFEHLRLETGDDVALGIMVKQAGGRVEMIDGRDWASVAIYRSLGELLRGIEKNGSTTASIPLPLLALAFALLGGVVASPVIAMLTGPLWLRALGALTLIAYTAGEVRALSLNTGRWAPALLWPISGAIMAYGALRSTRLAQVNGGVRWRDTFYSLEELDACRRFALVPSRARRETA